MRIKLFSVYFDSSIRNTTKKVMETIEYIVIRKTEDSGAESKDSANRNTLDHLIGHELATVVNKLSEKCDFHFTLRLVSDLDTLEIKRIFL